MRIALDRFLGIGVAALVTINAAPAQACLTEPSPPWSSILGPEGPDLMVGRVVKIDVAGEPRTSESIEVLDETITVERVRALQGSPDTEYQLTQPHSWRYLSTRGLNCGLWRVQLRVDDLVIAYEGQDGALHIVQPAHVPSDLNELLESLR